MRFSVAFTFIVTLGLLGCAAKNNSLLDIDSVSDERIKSCNLDREDLGNIEDGHEEFFRKFFQASLIYGEEIDITQVNYLPLLSSPDKISPYEQISAEIIKGENSNVVLNSLKFKPKAACNIVHIVSDLEVTLNKNGLTVNDHILSIKMK